MKRVSFLKHPKLPAQRVLESCFWSVVVHLAAFGWFGETSAARRLTSSSSSTASFIEPT
jgi:hypothetical protein